MNPNPKQGYEITLTIKDAPGPFESIEGFMQYEVRGQDDACAPMSEDMSGHTLRLSEDIPVIYFRVSDNVYRTTIYTDLLVDENYYGLGVCKWTMVATRAELKGKEANFIATLRLDDMLSQKERTVYFWAKDYFDASIDNYASFGETDPNRFVGGKTNAFSVILAAKEMPQ